MVPCPNELWHCILKSYSWVVFVVLSHFCCWPPSQRHPHCCIQVHAASALKFAVINRGHSKEFKSTTSLFLHILTPNPRLQQRWQTSTCGLMNVKIHCYDTEGEREGNKGWEKQWDRLQIFDEGLLVLLLFKDHGHNWITLCIYQN